MTKNNDSLDCLKVILSVLIVILHSHPLGEKYHYIFYPLVRVAVPVFFIISGFLFFNKCERSNPIDALKRYVIRNMKLYAFWECVLLPVTIYVRDYFSNGMLNGFLQICKGFLFGSTFIASWYIIASVFGICICFMLKRHNSILFLLGLSLYVICCLSSNYQIPSSNVTHIIDHVNSVIYLPCSFASSIIWIWMGKIVAEKDIKTIFRPFVLAGICILMYIVLLIEHIIIVTRDWFTQNNDCYFSLLLVCPFVFLVTKKLDVKVNNARNLRAISTITYCLHPSLSPIIRKLYSMIFHISEFEIPYSIISFLTLIGLCYVASVLIVRFSKKYKILKLAY